MSINERINRIQMGESDYDLESLFMESTAIRADLYSLVEANYDIVECTNTSNLGIIFTEAADAHDIGKFIQTMSDAKERFKNLAARVDPHSGIRELKMVRHSIATSIPTLMSRTGASAILSITAKSIVSPFLIAVGFAAAVMTFAIGYMSVVITEKNMTPAIASEYHKEALEYRNVLVKLHTQALQDNTKKGQIIATRLNIQLKHLDKLIAKFRIKYSQVNIGGANNSITESSEEAMYLALESIDESCMAFYETLMLEDVGMSDANIAEDLTDYFTISILESIAGVDNNSDLDATIQDVKKRIDSFTIHFDPYKGLKELRLINHLIKDAEMKQNIHRVGSFTGHVASKSLSKDEKSYNYLIPALASIISTMTTIVAQSSKYKKMDKKLIDVYIKEAEEFKSNLNAVYDIVSRKQDKDSKRFARRIKLTTDRLFRYIEEFRNRSGANNE